MMNINVEFGLDYDECWEKSTNITHIAAYLVGFTIRMKTASVSEFRVELKEPGATKMTVVVPMIFRVVISPVGMTQHVERNKLHSTNS